MATDTVRPAAVQATECALALLDGLRLTLEVTERFTERVDLAQAAMRLAERLPAVAGVRNRKAAGDGVRRNHTVAARECSGWKNCFESAERNLDQSAQAFDAEIGQLPPRARQQVVARLAKAQPTAVSFNGFDPTYWEAETVRSLAGHTLGAMNRFLDADCGDPESDDPDSLEGAINLRSGLVRDLKSILRGTDELDRLKGELSRDLAMLSDGIATKRKRGAPSKKDRDERIKAMWVKNNTPMAAKLHALWNLAHENQKVSIDVIQRLITGWRGSSVSAKNQKR